MSDWPPLDQPWANKDATFAQRLINEAESTTLVGDAFQSYIRYKQDERMLHDAYEALKERLNALTGFEYEDFLALKNEYDGKFYRRP